MSRLAAMTILAAALACGSSQADSGNVGQTHAGDDLDTPKDTTPVDGTTTAAVPDAAVPDAPPSPVTIAITNSGSEDLVFSMDKGWQPNIFGFSGKPPKAKAIIMFPKFCTAACDAADEERCPYCPEPEKVKEIRAAEKREVVAPGATLEVPWDEQVYVYERAKGTREGKTKRCECYKASPVPAETYTVRVCGLRVTKVADKRSQLQCVDGTMTVPSEEPLRVELDFPDPKAPGKKK